MTGYKLQHTKDSQNEKAWQIIKNSYFRACVDEQYQNFSLKAQIFLSYKQVQVHKPATHNRAIVEILVHVLRLTSKYSVHKTGDQMISILFELISETKIQR